MEAWREEGGTAKRPNAGKRERERERESPAGSRGREGNGMEVGGRLEERKRELFAVAVGKPLRSGYNKMTSEPDTLRDSNFLILKIL